MNLLILKYGNIVYNTLMVRELFRGKKKFVSIPALIVGIIYAWPILIGGAFARLTYKFIPFTKLKIALVAVIALFSLPIGVTWASVMVTPAPVETEQKIDSVPTVAQPTTIPTKKEEPTATPSAISFPTKIPAPTTKPRALPTRVPTKYVAPTRANVHPISKPTVYVAPVVQPVSQETYSGGDKDCGDFSSHAEAQAFFLANGGPASDPHRLDRDNDGLACENN